MFEGEDEASVDDVCFAFGVVVAFVCVWFGGRGGLVCILAVAPDGYEDGCDDGCDGDGYDNRVDHISLCVWVCRRCRLSREGK